MQEEQKDEVQAEDNEPAAEQPQSADMGEADEGQRFEAPTNEPIPTPGFQVRSEVKLPRVEQPELLDLGPDMSGIQLPEFSPIPGPRTALSVTATSALSPQGKGARSPLRQRSRDKPQYPFTYPSI